MDNANDKSLGSNESEMMTGLHWSGNREAGREMQGIREGRRKEEMRMVVCRFNRII